MYMRNEYIHAICPRGTEKYQNFDPSKPIPTGRRFSRKICFVPESLWPVKCTAFSDFWTGQIAIKTIITRSSKPSHVYCTYLAPVQRCGEVFRQYLGDDHLILRGGLALLVGTDYLFSSRARPENLFPGKPRTEYLFSTATFLKKQKKKEKKRGGGGG